MKKTMAIALSVIYQQGVLRAIPRAISSTIKQKKEFLVKSSAEIIHAATAEEAAEWETHEDVKYVEKGTCLEALQSND
jgi:hypothetical protein